MISIVDKLHELNQGHLLQFYNQLNSLEQEKLLDEISKIDFRFMKQLYDNSYFDEEIDISKIDSLKCLTKVNDIENEEYIQSAEEIIKQNQYAIVMLAGGSASRLGLGMPKGCLKLNINEKYISLFELYINQLKEIKKQYDINLNLYIMTSQNNYLEIKNFFAENRYFNYPKENIHFFKQDELPILDTKGNILLKEKNEILFGPNGNGNVFNALKKSKLLDDLIKKNIKYVLFSTIDNVLAKLVDMKFIGATINNNYKLASKTITKESADEKDWIFCKYNNHPFMLPSAYITEEITNCKNSKDEYIYREKNITYHLISTDLLLEFSEMNLKYHRAYKKNNYIDENGNKIIANSPNTFKFEQFIFDAFYFADDMLLYRINKDEFCPIKTQEDIEYASHELAKRMIENETVS